MNGLSSAGSPVPSPRAIVPVAPTSINWRQFAGITVAALAVFVLLRLLPTGTNLSHMDFRATGANAIEFCDPLNPQFISVVSARSPVTMTVAPGGVSETGPGREFRAVVSLQTGSGKPIAPADLLVTHTRRLHLLIVDRTLADYQHVHPEPGRAPETWEFSFTPQLGGSYRVFADFTPAATSRGLYASADLAVGPAGADRTNATAGAPVAAVERDGFRFTLVVAPQPPRAGLPFDLRFSIRRPDGGGVNLQPVMGAFAHLVAFDEARNGFAHLHPMEVDPLQPPDAVHPVMNFKLTIPQSGRYVIWAQVNVDGREVFVPFGVEVPGPAGN